MNRFAFATLSLIAFGSVASACERCAPVSRTGFKFAAPEPEAPVETPKQKKHRQTAEKVFQELLLVYGEPVDDFVWPPKLEFVEVDGNGGEYNAYANVRWDKKTGKPIKQDGKFIPFVAVTWGYLELLDGDANAIALVLGHELGHHALGHTTQERVLKPGALAGAHGHRREADADLFGARLMLKAGYSLRKAVKIEWLGLDSRGWIQSAASGTCRSHPADSDRAKRLFTILDKGEEELWRCMVAFENGVTFLAIDNFVAAEQCFLRVTQEFPNCYEAHANLGLARLRRYCAGLSAKDVRKLEVGHFLESTYYPTARSLVLTRGNNDELWYSAVADLKRANELKANSPLILANLGLAYLIHPAGKAQGIGDATQYLDAAIAAMETTKGLPTQVRATLLVNFGVAQLAEGNHEKGRKFLAAAAELTQVQYARFLEAKKRAEEKGQTIEDVGAQWRASVMGAVAYNTGLALAETNQKEAVRQFEKFLATTPQSSPWWPVAYEQYETLCKANEMKARPKSALGKAAPWQKQLVPTLTNGKTVHVGQDLDEALAALGKPDRVTRIQDTGLSRLHFDAHGLYLVADAEEVFAVIITSAKGPGISIREAGPGGKVLGEIRVGMTREQVEAIPGGKTTVKLPFLTQNDKGQFYVYDYYADLNVALTYDKDGVVTSIVVGQLTELKRD